MKLAVVRMNAGVYSNDVVPLSSKYGTYETVMPKFWPWLSG